MYVVYGIPNCTFCNRAKALLESLGEQYEYIDVDGDPNLKAELKERLSEEAINLPKITMPQIWTENEYIGGFDQLNSILR